MLRYLAVWTSCLAIFAGGCGNPSESDLYSSTGNKKNSERTEFDRVFADWKSLLGDLRDLKIKFRLASDEQKRPIADQFYTRLAEGVSLETDLLNSAINAYAKAPVDNDDLKKFLTTSAGILMAQQQYEDALRVTNLLIEQQVGDPETYKHAIDAAMGSNRFDLAEKYFGLAKKAGLNFDQEAFAKALWGSDRPDIASEIEYYKEGWQRESELRESEQLATDLPRVLLRTDRGEIELELFEIEAPNTVANFIYLVEKKFYDGLGFHRVIPGFVAQAGCPKGDGSGSPGYTIRCESHQPNARRHFRGSLSMAHRGRDTGGSQFYLTFRPAKELDKKHTVFGRIIRGMDVLAKLQPRNDDPISQRIQPDKIIDAKVLRKRDHDYKPKILALDEPDDSREKDSFDAFIKSYVD